MHPWQKLAKLQRLRIQNTEEMEEIVGKDETAAEGEFPKFKFPCLTYLTLRRLCKLLLPWKTQSGRSQARVLGVPSLEVFHCGMLDIFTQELQSIPEDDDGSSSNGCSLYSLHHEYGFLNNIPNIGALEVFCGGFNMIFPSQRLEVEDNRILAQLRELCLEMLTGLRSIGLEYSWIDPLCSNLLLVLKVALQQYYHLKLSDYPKIDKVWHNEAKLPKLCFGKLETLVVENCDFLSTVLPLYLITYLKNLKKLQVKNCIEAEEPKGIADFRNTKEVQVTKCSGLKTLFTTSLSKLRKLKKLTIKSCEAMKEIVEKDEVAAESINAEFVFLWLTLLVLSEMPKLKFFYARKHNLVIPKLEDLSLNEKQAMMLWHEESQQNLLRNIKCLRLYCFHNANEADALPFGFLLKVPNMETLAIACSEFKEIFPFRKLENDHIAKLVTILAISIL
ncbi:hypothetical protein L6164_002759 [Bauhinia variegata]|uniref:Uncharacterized protein n=1 Tax=Bauhinia variegata TaxID=167791 RepID=A0ACB9Q1V4_BAUVA|nr:hypothetical protein L6164_002759 [Bauhinia variegata]